VRSGTVADAEFAADLSMVLRGDAPPEYRDPAPFFANTFPTRGLKNLLANVCSRFRRGTGVASIFRLDTSYGGGKTHGRMQALISPQNASRSC
jgi:predicted AAA+ superfamily ATPase